jgi:hypothetical protein
MMTILRILFGCWIMCLFYPLYRISSRQQSPYAHLLSIICGIIALGIIDIFLVVIGWYGPGLFIGSYLMAVYLCADLFTTVDNILGRYDQ